MNKVRLSCFSLNSKFVSLCVSVKILWTQAKNELLIVKLLKFVFHSSG